MVWPTAEQERLLRLALLSPADARAARDLLGGIDARGLDSTSRRLLPLLYPILRDLGARGPLLDEAAVQYRLTASRNAALFDRGRALIRDLTDAGVATLALKGAALVSQYYRDPGLRSMADMDLLIPLKALFPALGAFQRGGWTPRFALTSSLIRTRHAAPFTTDDGFACDLHWRVFPEPGPPGVEDAMWAASTDVDFYGVRARVLSPADQLFHVCLHGARWAPVPAVWWIGDAVTIIRAGGVDWGRIVSQAVAYRFVLRLREALGYLRDRLDAAIPADVLGDLRARRVSALERLEWRVLGREHRVLGELPMYWCCHRRSDEGAGWRGVLAFLPYLQDAWVLKSPADLPRAVVNRVVARAAAALRRSRTTDEEWGA